MTAKNVFGNLLAPAVVAFAIIAWRGLHVEKKLPPPSDFIAAVMIFGALSLFPPEAGPLATSLGWGLDVAALLDLPSGIWGPKQQAPAGAPIAGPDKGRAPNPNQNSELPGHDAFGTPLSSVRTTQIQWA
jgi:hypothetical protein